MDDKLEGEYIVGQDAAAALLGVTTRSVQRYQDRGLLAGTHIHGRWYFRRADIDEFRRVYAPPMRPRWRKRMNV